MGVEIKVLKIEGVPTGHTVTFSIKCKDEDASAVTPSEARTNRRVLVSSDYPNPEWRNEAYYFKPVNGKKYAPNPQTARNTDDNEFLDHCQPKFYLWAVGSVYDSRIASGRIHFRSALPGKPVREVFHLAFESGFSSPGRSCHVTIELLADLTEEMTGIGPILGRLPAVQQPTTALSPGASPTKTAVTASKPPATTSPTSRGRSLSFSKSPGAVNNSLQASPSGNIINNNNGMRTEVSGIYLSGDQRGTNFGDETNVDDLLENLQRVFPILEQRLHIVTRSLDRRDRQLLDMKSRLVRKTSEANGLQNDSKVGRETTMELADKLKEVEELLAVQSKKAHEGEVAEKLSKKLLTEKDEIIDKLRQELIDKREKEEEAVRAQKAASAELERLKKKLEIPDETAKDRTAGNAELFAEKTIAEVRVHGLTAELSEAQHQLSRSRARETMLMQNNSTLQARNERLSYEIDKKTAELAELHRATERQLDQRHSKTNELLARQDIEVKQTREEKEHLLRDLDRLRVNLNDSEAKLREAESVTQVVKRHHRELLTELDDTKAELMRVKEAARIDQTELLSELTTARENENAAKRLETTAEADAKRFRLQLQDAERDKQRLSNELAELKVRLEAANRKAFDLENEVKKERQATETAVQQSRDIMEASTSETLRMGEMLKISQELASALADQLRNERQQKEAAEADKDRVKQDAEGEKKRQEEQNQKEKNALLKRETDRVLSFQVQSLMTIERATRDAFVSGFELGVDSITSMLTYSSLELLHMEQMYKTALSQRDALDRELHQKEEEEKARLLREQERKNRELAEKEAEDDVDTCEVGLDPIDEVLIANGQDPKSTLSHSPSFSSGSFHKDRSTMSRSPSKMVPPAKSTLLNGPMHFGPADNNSNNTICNKTATENAARSKSPQGPNAAATAGPLSPSKSLSRPPPPPPPTALDQTAPGNSIALPKAGEEKTTTPEKKSAANNNNDDDDDDIISVSPNNKKIHVDPNSAKVDDNDGEEKNEGETEPIASENAGGKKGKKNKK